MKKHGFYNLQNLNNLGQGEFIDFYSFKLACKARGSDPNDKQKGRQPDGSLDVREILI